MSQGFTKGFPIDADPALTLDSDLVVPTQKAVKAYVASKFPTTIDFSSYPVVGTLGVAHGGTGATSITGLVKGNGTSAFTAAVAGTDYLAPSTNIVIGNSADVTPDASWTSHLKILGNGYSGGISLDATGMWVGHNSGSRTLILATNETARVSINGTTGLVTFNNGASLGLTGLLKGNGASAITAAVAGTDYLAPAAIGVTVQEYDGDLAAIAALAGTSGFLKKTAANTWSLDTTVLVDADIGVSVQAYDGDLAAIAALAGTSGFLKKTAANTWSLDTNTYLTTGTAASTYAPIASPTFTGTATSPAYKVTNASAASYLYLNTNTPLNRGLYVQTNNVLRWFVGANNAGETGFNDGSNFIFAAYSDDGSTFLGNYITIYRGSGITNIRELSLVTDLDAAYGGTGGNGSVTGTGANVLAANPDFTGQVGFANGTAAAPSISFTTDANTGMYLITGDVLGFATGGTEKWRITSDGTWSNNPNLAINSATETGVYLSPAGRIACFYDANPALIVGRQTSDGNMVQFHQAGVNEGAIAVSGTTITYGSFSGSHWSQLADNSRPEILKGTVVETIDDKCEWGEEENDQLAKFRISDTPASKRVYGVFMMWDEDDDGCNDAHITGLGAYLIRIAPGVTVQGGDLLESNGDGCARVQADDIIRSSTIGKVTSPIHTHDYEDGSYTVPCVLYCG